MSTDPGRHREDKPSKPPDTSAVEAKESASVQVTKLQPMEELKVRQDSSPTMKR